MKMPWAGSFALVVIVLLAAEPAVAQDVSDGRHGFVGLGIGPSAPFGNFADASAGNARAGLARPGYTSTLLNLGYRFGHRFGVAAAFSYSEYFTRDGGGDDWWQVAGFTIGPMYSHHFNARAALDLKGMFGVFVLTPVVDSYTTADGTGSGFGVDLRAALRYNVYRRWALFTEAGIQSAGVSFDTGVRKDYRAIISGFGVAFRPRW
ncbi:MAG: hypothetical protein ACNA8K_16445 [Cyclonatronaceae bacterium]